MRADLADAAAAVDWANAHIPVLQERFVTWQRRGPYELVMEPDPNDTKWEFLVAYLRVPLDPMILGDVGAIINSIRTSLDLLMSAVLTANGIKPNSSAHFPIRKHAADFLAAIKVMEDKKWITAREAAAIKKQKAYEGGPTPWYKIHQLDILRKHERLLVVEPTVNQSMITLLGGASYAYRRAMQDKAILYRIPAKRFRPTKGNTLLAADIFFNEPALGITHEPAIFALRTFAAGVRGYIDKFP